MTIEFESLEVTKTETLSRGVCELCGCGSTLTPGTIPDWSRESYLSKTTVIELQDYEQYPGCAPNGTSTYTSVCPDCFQGKVVPALEAIGIKFYTREFEG